MRESVFTLMSDADRAELVNAILLQRVYDIERIIRRVDLQDLATFIAGLQVHPDDWPKWKREKR